MKLNEKLYKIHNLFSEEFAFNDVMLRAWSLLPRRVSSKRCLLAACLALLLLLLYYSRSSLTSRPKLRRLLRFVSDRKCHKCCIIHFRAPDFCPGNKPSREQEDDLSYWSCRAGGGCRVLIISPSPRTSPTRDLTELLVSLRVRYKTVATGHKLPELTSPGRGVGRYRAVIFQDVGDYHSLDTSDRRRLDQYCKQFSVGLILFVPPGAERPLGVRSVKTLSHQLVRTIKTNLSIHLATPGPVWVDLSPHVNSSDVVPVVQATFADGSLGPVVLEDRGTHTGVGKIMFGGSRTVNFWFIKLLLMDALHHLTGGDVSFPLTRYVLVDIDDIFVGAARLVKSDVASLVDSQLQLSGLVSNFHYNLGFSGKYFKSGSEEENEGDVELVRQREKFWWFPHMWKHLQPHRFDNVSELEERMKLNREFSTAHSLPVRNSYSVAPHHSGVFPVHEQLYQAWRSVWGITVTSTEEYPNLRPARRRRGFSHAGVDVLPRQTCGLYTKNLHYDEYPGGAAKLEASIQGGELFLSVLTNPVSIFMTHMPNYCCDRLAPYTFQSLFSFISCHTNLNLVTQTPTKLAATYFSLFPEERQAVWSNPCEDNRHEEIWSDSKSCDKLPQVLVVGPQKTGTTALHSFLNLHPNVVSSYPSKETFEEVQFFSSRRYTEGLDWYMDHFPPGNHSVTVFEKSATYFDGENVPFLAHKLLPRAKIVVVLIPPGERAYSWYQHMIAHSDQTASNFSFKEVLLAGSESPRPLLSLRSRCLQPGEYAEHLERWLQHYKPSSIVIIDGIQLRNDPVTVMNNIQEDLDISPSHDYNNSLLYDSKKGFYCMKVKGKKKCLGKGKGRKYPPMDEISSKWLLDYYRESNESLERLLIKLGYPVPGWLTSLVQ